MFFSQCGNKTLTQCWPIVTCKDIVILENKLFLKLFSYSALQEIEETKTKIKKIIKNWDKGECFRNQDDQINPYVCNQSIDQNDRLSYFVDKAILTITSLESAMWD